ncbi:unnamed protein product [Dicrocoelium dendriticum]|nr:unnamed protein product [Dicrocoelium dendriticum]
MAGAPSVQTPTNFDHSGMFTSRNFFTIRKTSSPRVVVLKDSENKYRTYTSSWEQDATSVDSSNWIAKKGLDLISLSTVFKICLLMSSIRLLMVLFESDIRLIFSA